MGFLCGSAGKESTHNVGDLGSIPGLGRFRGERKEKILQYSGLENSMDCIVHGVAKSRRRLSDFHFHPLLLPTSRAWKRIFWQLIPLALGGLGLLRFGLPVLRYNPFPSPRDGISRGRVQVALSECPLEGWGVAAVTAAQSPRGLSFLVRSKERGLLSRPAHPSLLLPPHRHLEVLIPMGVCPLARMPLLRDNFTGPLYPW